MSDYIERIRPLHLAAAGIVGAAIAATLVGLVSQRTEVSTPLGRIEPVGSLLDAPFIAEDQPEAQSVAPQVASRAPRRIEPQVVSPADPVAQPRNAGGDTDVTVQNGVSDTETESGGASTSNNAEMHVRTGPDFDDPED